MSIKSVIDPSKKKACFIVFEGMDGCGKTTQMKRFGETLRESGKIVFETREPGGSSVGDQIRSILKNPSNHISPVTELMLFMAARRDHLETIEQEFYKDQIILCDRFYHSTMAYQAYGHRLNERDDEFFVDNLGFEVTEGLEPDLNVIIRTAMPLCKIRMGKDSRGEDRIDSKGVEFFQRVFDYFEDIEVCIPLSNRIIVNGNGTFEHVAKEIVREFADWKTRYWDAKSEVVHQIELD